MIIDAMGSWTARRPTAVPAGKTFIDEALDNGVTCMSETIIADVDFYDLHYAIRAIDDFHWLLHVYNQKTMLIECVDDIYRAKASNKLGFIGMLQGGNTLFGDLAVLRMFHKMGIRSIALTYMCGNALGCGCQDLNDTGLTRLGQKVVREMNRVGIAVDLSHVGMRTALDAIHYSTAPVVYTHSNVKAITDHPRNISNDHLDALKQNDGLICLTPVSAFCKKSSDRPTMNDFIDQIAYTADRIGVEHVGIATDRMVGGVLDEAMILSKSAPEMLEFSLSGKHVDGAGGFKFWPNLCIAMKERGFSKNEIDQIFGENYINTVKKIWK